MSDDETMARDIAIGWLARGSIPTGLPPIPVLARAAELYRQAMTQREKAASQIA